ncbi:class I SAM-dependent methyltransferase [Leptolyngbya sp. AN03gr2]|uniref:class I SAM-dependent methyltransferase n=1 Tax=unclassified Leptolyngbya TaxID=2650499 RepID=UPI003D311D58
MNQLEPTQQLTGVAETLMITLYARVVETKRSDGLLQDPKAVEIAERTDYDFRKYEKGWASQLGVIIRVREYDRIVQSFLTAHPNAIVINLGCGLCTRFNRVDNGTVKWYEVDFSEVIDLRRKFFEESDRYRFIARSILDFAWIDQIQREPNQPLMVIMEGVSPYLSEAENQSIVLALRDRLAPLHLVLDILNRSTASKSKQHDTVSKTTAEFKSGFDSGQELETWGEGIRLENEIYSLTQFADHPNRLPLWARYIRFLLVPVFKNSARILQLNLIQL